jgi:hypothetical protein
MKLKSNYQTNASIQNHNPPKREDVIPRHRSSSVKISAGILKRERDSAIIHRQLAKKAKITTVIPNLDNFIMISSQSPPFGNLLNFNKL